MHTQLIHPERALTRFEVFEIVFVAAILLATTVVGSYTLVLGARLLHG